MIDNHYTTQPVRINKPLQKEKDNFLDLTMNDTVIHNTNGKVVLLNKRKKESIENLKQFTRESQTKMDTIEDQIQAVHFNDINANSYSKGSIHQVQAQEQYKKNSKVLLASKESKS